MNQFYDPNHLTLGQQVGLEMDPYTLNYPLGNNKSAWVADQGGRPFVLRFYEPNKGSPDAFMTNARKYASIKHPAITPNYPPFYSSLWMFSVAAVCGGEKLYSYLGKYPDGAPLNVVLSVFENIARALDQAHKNNLFHGHLDLNSVHVVNGTGIMVGFGSHNWMTELTSDDMELRFAAPESISKSRKISAESDRYSFMRLLLALLVGESKITQDLNLQNLPNTLPEVSHDNWQIIKKFCRTAPRHRPKSLMDIMRLLRANLYEVSTNKTPKALPKKSPIATVFTSKKIFSGVSITSLSLLALVLWPSEEIEKAAVTPEMTAEEVFEQLPQQLEEPLKVGSTAPKVTKLPPATFPMGDGQNIGDDNEKPLHDVEIPRGFYMSSYEVTFAQYDLFAQSTNRPLPPDNEWGRGNRPVINVSWYDAKAYSAWVSEQTGKTYRLPTEIEWEYSIRAGSTSSFWYGEEVQNGYSVCDSCGSQWDGVSTAPVGSQISNPLGLFDMHGNVAEWVEDCYHDSYEGAPTKNTPWLSNACDSRVIRGGSWFDIPRVGRSSTRYRAEPNLKASNWGFRLVREIDASEQPLNQNQSSANTVK